MQTVELTPEQKEMLESEFGESFRRYTGKTLSICDDETTPRSVDLTLTMGQVVDSYYPPSKNGEYGLPIDVYDCRLYIVQDGDATFYVGKSQDIPNRIMSHMGERNPPYGQDVQCSDLGTFMIDNAPASRNWTVRMLTVGAVGDALGDALGVGFSEHPHSVDQAERALIAMLRPALNRALTINGCQAIPKSYKNRWDDNGEGAMRAARTALGEGVE